jgi:hypothetical protein
MLSVVEELTFHYTRETSATLHHLRQQPHQLAPEAAPEIGIRHIPSCKKNLFMEFSLRMRYILRWH